jgi:hypothetical protein
MTMTSLAEDHVLDPGWLDRLNLSAIGPQLPR